MAKLGAEPFFFAGGEEGVLLIHGYTGAPGMVIPAHRAKCACWANFCTAKAIPCWEYCCRAIVRLPKIYLNILLTTGMRKLSAVMHGLKPDAARFMWQGFQWAGCLRCGQRRSLSRIRPLLWQRRFTCTTAGSFCCRGCIF